jgi:hypothetical protein
MKRIRTCAARTLTAAMLCVGVLICIAAGSRGPAVRVAAAAQGLSAAPQHRPEDRTDRGHPYRENGVLLWNAALLDAVRAIRFAPMFTARAPDRTLMAVEITGTGATFNHSAPNPRPLRRPAHLRRPTRGLRVPGAVPAFARQFATRATARSRRSASRGGGRPGMMGLLVHTAEGAANNRVGEGGEPAL